MNYGLFLYADLATGERIEILKRDFGGAPRKIAALSSWSWRPLDNDSAEVTDTPIVKGTLSMSIKDMRDFDYTAFFTVDSTLWRVVLKYGGVTRWSGYVQPESYSSNSEYRSDINIMALDNLGQLEHIEYDYFDYSFVSLRDLVQRACGLVGWNFAPIIFDTRVVSGDGVLIEDAVLNVETFRKKTWWEVLSDVLFSFGLQLAYFDDNTYRISSVANKFDATRIVDIPNYTIESGCTSDIVPPWKSASVEQNLQIINDFFYFPSGSDYSVVGSYIINAYNEKYKGISDSPLMDWGLWAAKVKTLIPNGWQNNGCNILSGQSMLNDRTGALYLETIIKDTSPSALTAFVSKQMDIPTILAGVSIELSLGSREWYVLWEDFDYSDFTEDNPLAIRGYAQKFAPWVVQSFEILYSFQITYDYVDGDGVAQKIILKEKWEKLSDKNKDSRIEFTAHIEKEVSDKKYNINIASLPAQGSLELKIFRPKLLNTGSIIKEGATSFCRIADIQMSGLTMPEIGSTKTNVGIIKSARTKKGLSLSYGELPPKYTCIDYAGGVFQGVRFNPALHDWQRTDGLGGVLPLSEIVWRGYVHHFSRFQTNAGEPAGGKVLRGRFPFEGLKLNNVLKYSTKESTEYYVINSASITGREADLTLMQVIPYAHYTDFDIENFVDAGGGSYVGGGGDTYVTHMTGGGGADLNGKRLFALDEAADDQIDDLYLLADKPGNTVAQKIKARAFARRTHAKQHFKGGADEIKPYDIDAAQRAGDKTQDFAAQDLTARNATVADTARALKVISPNITSPEFLAAMLGYGFGMYMDENGESHLHVDHGHFRGSIETLEARFRKMTFSGEDFLVSDGGYVAEILPLGQTYLSTPNGRLVITQDERKIIVPSNGRVVFKLKGEEGIDLTQFQSGDILWYTWRNTETGINGASGFLLVKHNFDTFWYEAEVLAGSPERLRVGMAIGQRGNDTNKSRQGFIHLSGRDKCIAIWDGVDSHVLSPEMLKAYLGDLRYVSDPRFPEMKGYGLYAQSCYLKGVFVLKSTGKTVEAEIKASADGIKLEVSKTYATKVETSKIEQTAKEIKLEVSKKVNGTEVISSINQSAEKVKIKAENIEFEGTVTANGNTEIHKDGTFEAVNGKFTGSVTATSGSFTGAIYASSGRISGELKIGAHNKITPTEITYRDANGHRVAALGDNLAATYGWQSAATFKSTDPSTIDGNGNTALIAEASGARTWTNKGGNHAIHIPRGDISGFSFFLNNIDSSDNGITLSANIGYYSCSNSSEMTVNLPSPSSTQVGNVILIFKATGAPVNVQGSMLLNGRSISSERIGDNGTTAMFVNNGSYWCGSRMGW